MKKKTIELLVIFSILTFVLWNSVQAQPSLSFNRIKVNWPTISLYVSVKCGSDFRFDLTTANFKIKENGIDITDYTVICPEIDQWPCSSVAFIIDRSRSMSFGNPSGLDDAKADVKAFIDLMNGHCDEASLISFNQVVTADVFMTNNNVILKKGVDSLKAGGGKAVWDGVIKGMQELINNGMTESRAVILLTDGEDNASINTLDDVMTLALANKIKIFTIGIGTGINDADLFRIATDTGGRYYKDPSPSQLRTIYFEISRIARDGGVFECEIQYNSRCMTGTRRDVELTLQKLFGCPGIDVKTEYFMSPRDTSTFMPITIRLGQETVLGDQTVNIPILLDTPLYDHIFGKSTFEVLFDDNCTKLIDISAKGYLLDNVAIDMKSIPGGFQFITSNSILLNGNGILAMLKFKASNPETDKECPLKLFGWTFESGCLRPVQIDGKIIINARMPNITGDLEVPLRLTFDSKSKEYQPNPFPVTATATNIGDREARNGVATLLFDKNDFVLLTPSLPKQILIPYIIPANGGFAKAQWYLYAKNHLKADTALVSALVTFDNHPDIHLDQKIYIPASILTEVEHSSLPSSFYLGQNYPNPFTQQTTIDLTPPLSCKERVTEGRVRSFKVYDVFGREVLDLSNNIIDNGRLTIDNSQLPTNGIYFYRVTIGNESQTKMMMMLK